MRKYSQIFGNTRKYSDTFENIQKYSKYYIWKQFLDLKTIFLKNEIENYQFDIIIFRGNVSLNSENYLKFLKVFFIKILMHKKYK